MKYSLDPSSENCYEGTTCLVNKFNIRDDKKLLELEAQITFAKTVMLEESPIEGDFDFQHFKKIHKFCFVIFTIGQVKFGLWIFQKNGHILSNSIR